MKQRNAKSLIEVLPNTAEIPMLTVEEELVLVAQIRNGDADAVAKLKFHNLRFVASVAKQYQNQGLTMEQLIEEGNNGLVKAAERYDESKGFKFLSYAVWWIRQSILEALMAMDAKRRGLPTQEYTLLTARERGILRDLEDGDSLEQIAEERRLTVERVRQIRELALRKLNRQKSTDQQ